MTATMRVESVLERLGAFCVIWGSHSTCFGGNFYLHIQGSPTLAEVKEDLDYHEEGAGKLLRSFGYTGVPISP
jgi:hypothetical protein